MAKIVVFHELPTGLGTLTVKAFRMEQHASYTDGSKDTQQNGTETAAEESNRKGTYRATDITDGAAGDLSGLHSMHLFDVDTNYIGTYYADMTPAGTSAAPIVACSTLSEVLGVVGIIDVNTVQVSGDSTAADNMEVTFDGTGYGFTNCTMPTTTTVTNPVTVGAVNAAGLADFFDTDSTKTYADAVSGSVVKEIADNAGGGGGGVSESTLVKYVSLLARKDSAVGTDLSTQLGNINQDYGSGAGSYATTTDSLEAIRDRGDGAWITAVGFSTFNPASDKVILADAVHGGTSARFVLERIVVASTTTNEPAVKLIGDGYGAGLLSTGGSGGNGISAVGTGQGSGIVASGVYALSASGSTLGMYVNGLNVDGIFTATNASNDIRGVQVNSVTAAALADFFDTDSTKVYADAVNGSVVKEIANNVRVVTFAAGAIDAAAIADGAIDAATFAAGAINAAAIADGAIDAATFAAGAINAAAIADGAIDAATFAAGAIDAAAIANGAIDAATFAADVDAEILSYLVDDSTRIDASALNTLSSHDPGETISSFDAATDKVILADAVHGGTSARFVLERIIVESTTTNEPGVKMVGNGAGAGLYVESSVFGGITTASINVTGPFTATYSGNDIRGVRVASFNTGAIDAAAFAAGAITATVIADGAIDAATFAADVDAEFLSYIVDDATRIDASALNTLSSHDPGAMIGTSTLTQTQVSGGSYALNSASFAFNAALDLTTAQKASVNAEVDTALGDYGALKPTVGGRTLDVSSDGKVILADAAHGGSLASLTLDTVSVSGGVAAMAISNDIRGVQINSVTAAALADFFDTDSTKVYADAVAGSVVKEIGDRAVSGVGALLPADFDTLTIANGLADVNVVKIHGNEDAATGLRDTMLTVQSLVVQTDGSNSTTQFATDLPVENDDYYGNSTRGLVIGWTSTANNKFQTRRITASTTSSGNTVVTIDAALDAVPTDGDVAVVLGRG